MKRYRWYDDDLDDDKKKRGEKKSYKKEEKECIATRVRGGTTQGDKRVRELYTRDWGVMCTNEEPKRKDEHSIRLEHRRKLSNL